jgi:hypothetical protein
MAELPSIWHSLRTFQVLSIKALILGSQGFLSSGLCSQEMWTEGRVFGKTPHPKKVVVTETVLKYCTFAAVVPRSGPARVCLPHRILQDR